jgi:hypothetical protein
MKGIFLWAMSQLLRNFGNFYQTTRQNIAEHTVLQSHHRENVKSHNATASSRDKVH